jgi:hypothetical protein
MDKLLQLLLRSTDDMLADIEEDASETSESDVGTSDAESKGYSDSDTESDGEPNTESDSESWGDDSDVEGGGEGEGEMLAKRLRRQHTAMADALRVGDLPGFTRALLETSEDCCEIGRITEDATPIACGSYGCTYESPLAQTDGERAVVKVALQPTQVAEGTAGWNEAAIGTILTSLSEEERVTPVFMRVNYAAVCSRPSGCGADRSVASHLLRAEFVAWLRKSIGEEDAKRFRTPPVSKFLSVRALLPERMLRGKDPSGSASQEYAKALLATPAFVEALGRVSDSVPRTSVKNALENAMVKTAAALGNQIYLFAERGDHPFGYLSQSRSVQAVFLALVSGLIAANRACLFCHGDLHYGNVLLRDMRGLPASQRERADEIYDGPRWCVLRLYHKTIVAPFVGLLPLVIDYGLATAAVPGGRLPRDDRKTLSDVGVYGSLVAMPGPAFDILVFVRSLLGTEIEGMGEMLAVADGIARYAAPVVWNVNERPVMRSPVPLLQVERAVLKALPVFVDAAEVEDAQADALVEAGVAVDLRYRLF